jgi:hypothetical protein
MRRRDNESKRVARRLINKKKGKKKRGGFSGNFRRFRSRGCVPLPGMVGYDATVWDFLPTYPPRLTEHGAPGGPTYPPRIMERGAGNKRNYSENHVK